MPSWGRLITAPRGLTVQLRGHGGGVWVSGVGVGVEFLQSAPHRELSLRVQRCRALVSGRGTTQSGLCLCVVLAWRLTPGCLCPFKTNGPDKNASAQNSLVMGNPIILLKWRGLAGSCPHVCRERVRQEVTEHLTPLHGAKQMLNKEQQLEFIITKSPLFWGGEAE